MDQEVVRAAQRGDRDAFAAIVRARAGRLYPIAYRILRDRALAEDAVQNAFLSAWQQLHSLRDTARLDPWLHRILVRACYDELRRRRPVAELEVDDAGRATPFDDHSRLAERDELDRAFRRLKPDQRAVVVLHHYVGLSLAEIAEIVGSPPGTVRSRLHYALAAMRAAVEADRRLTAEVQG